MNYYMEYGDKKPFIIFRTHDNGIGQAVYIHPVEARPRNLTEWRDVTGLNFWPVVSWHGKDSKFWTP